MAALNVEANNDAAIVIDVGPAVDGNDAAASTKLPRALGVLGVLTGSMAVAAAAYRRPRGVLAHGHELAYFLFLGAAFAAGVAEVWAALWVAGDARARRAAGKRIMCAAVVPLVLVVGLGGFAVKIKN